MPTVKSFRRFLKTDFWMSMRASGFKTDQEKKIPPLPPQKEYPKDAPLVDLIDPADLSLGSVSLIDVINQRRSRRKFTAESLTVEELSFLLWTTQGFQRTTRSYGPSGTLRTVPAGGSRHPFETYLITNRIDGLDRALYRYLPLDHKLVFLRSEPSLAKTVAAACYGQTWMKNAAVIFVWTAVPYRTEWRYTYVAAKTIAQDSGHLCQNLYLASEAICAGTCAVGAYYQDQMDAIVGADGVDEFVVYAAPVGKVRSQ